MVRVAAPSRRPRRLDGFDVDEAFAVLGGPPPGPRRVRRLDDREVGGPAYDGAKLDFVLPRGAFIERLPAAISEPLALGVVVEGNYLFSKPLTFSPTFLAAVDDRILVEGFSAGAVDLSGGELRLGFVILL